MESLTIDGFNIKGFPDAAKVVKIAGGEAARLSDLALHRADLDFADGCLEAINEIADHASAQLLRQALWRSAIIHFVKCFGHSSSRRRLSYDNIYRGEPPVARELFNFFKALRDKHVAHDENAMAQCLSGAIINKGDKPYKVEKIITFSVVIASINPEAYSNLKLLIEKARSSVAKQYTNLCERITKQLESETYPKLIAREEIRYRAPTIDEVDRPRQRSE